MIVWWKNIEFYTCFDSEGKKSPRPMVIGRGSGSRKNGNPAKTGIPQNPKVRES